MKRYFIVSSLIVATLFTAACGNSRRDEIDARKAALKQKQDSSLLAAQQELTDLTLLRMKRDSLKVQWDLLGAKIKYIRQKQKELEQ